MCGWRCTRQAKTFRGMGGAARGSHEVVGGLDAKCGQADHLQADAHRGGCTQVMPHAPSRACKGLGTGTRRRASTVNASAASTCRLYLHGSQHGRL